MKMMKSVAVMAPEIVRIVDDVPVPELQEYEALVRILTCGFCNGTDMQVIKGTLPEHEGMGRFPTLLGHEAMGEVVALGRKVKYISEGDHFLHPNLRANPGNGYTRTYGGMSDYGLVADHRAMLEDGIVGDLPFYKKFFALPKWIGEDDGAVFLSLCEGLSAARNFGVFSGCHIAVYGAGPMGLALMKYQRLLGAEEIVAIDCIQGRLESARRICSVDKIVNNDSRPALEVLGEGSFDIVVDAVGTPQILFEGTKLLKPGGKLCSMGVLKKEAMEINVTKLQNNTMLHMLNLPYGEYDVMEENLDLIQKGKVNPKDFYSHVVPRAEITECIRLVREKQALKVVLKIA
jgi:threonine dehydrogenase-like Zn-dependent dehydrogenase